MTLFILFRSNRELNFSDIGKFIKSSNPWLLAAAFVCMLLFIVFEGLSIHLISKRLGYKNRLLSSMVYSSADIYYSAITPSASGGQPASAYYMVGRIDPGATTFTLVFNLIAYTAAILVIGAAAFIIRPHVFAVRFDKISRGGGAS
ncbi:MAG: flippase-like domain-containing protein [Christensenellaceae bacterium]